MGDYQAARGYFRTANRQPLQAEFIDRLFSQPDDVLHLARRANAWAIAGDDQKAIADYTRVLELAPKSVLAHCWRAGRYVSSGDDAAAQADIDAALALHPDSAEAYACRVRLHQANFELDAALADYAKALEISPLRQEASIRRAVIFYFRGDLDSAYNELAAAVFREPPEAPLLLPMRLAGARSPGPATVQPAAPIVPTRVFGPSVAAAQLKLVRGDVEGAAEDLELIGSPHDDWLTFAKGIAWLARDEDQDLLQSKSGQGRNVLVAQSYFAAAKGAAPGDRFAGLYPPIPNSDRATPMAAQEPRVPSKGTVPFLLTQESGPSPAAQFLGVSIRQSTQARPARLLAARSRARAVPRPVAPALIAPSPSPPLPANPEWAAAGATYLSLKSPLVDAPTRYYRCRLPWEHAADLKTVEDLYATAKRIDPYHTTAGNWAAWLPLLRRIAGARTYLYDDPLLGPAHSLRTRFAALALLQGTLYHLARGAGARDTGRAGRGGRTTRAGLCRVEAGNRGGGGGQKARVAEAARLAAMVRNSRTKQDLLQSYAAIIRQQPDDDLPLCWRAGR